MTIGVYYILRKHNENYAFSVQIPQLLLILSNWAYGQLTVHNIHVYLTTSVSQTYVYTVLASPITTPLPLVYNRRGYMEFIPGIHSWVETPTICSSSLTRWSIPAHMVHQTRLLLMVPTARVKGHHDTWNMSKTCCNVSSALYLLMA